MSDVRLTVDGINHAGWLNVNIRRSLETIADSFELSITERWKGQSTPRPIKAGAACAISIDGERVITGYVDDAFPNYDASQHTIEIAGRSKTADLVDCSYFSNEDFKGKAFDVVAKTVCKPFGIDVIVNADIGSPFQWPQKMEPGETVFEFLDRLARYRALRMVSTVDGKLLITRTGTERVSTPLRLGHNILAASGGFSARDRFSEYKVIGQSASDSNTWGASASEQSGLSDDPDVKRYRPTLIIADSAVTTDECKRQARWHRNTRLGRSGAIVYTVRGWRHADGLWKPNTLVSVVDAFMGIEADRLITEVQYILDENGERTELQVMRPEGFDLVELPEDNSGDESRWLNVSAA